MKKVKFISTLLAAVLLMLILSACGKEKCFECGEPITKGYQVFGNTYCEDCFSNGSWVK